MTNVTGAVEEVEKVAKTLGLTGIITVIVLVCITVPTVNWIDQRWAYRESADKLEISVTELKQTTNQLKAYVDILSAGKYKLAEVPTVAPADAYAVPVAVAPQITAEQQKALDEFKRQLLAHPVQK